MVKQNSSRYVEYKTRSSHHGSTSSSHPNRVQVVHSSGGCCSSSKKPSKAPPPARPIYVQPTQPAQPHQPTAHERSHLKLDSPEPFYYRQGRIRKSPHRLRKPFHGKNQVHAANMNRNYPPAVHHPPPAAAAPARHPVKPKTNCCCTIL